MDGLLRRPRCGARGGHPARRSSSSGDCFEIGLGLAILAWPWSGLLLIAFVWKLGTEWLRPLAGEPMWDFIERGGSYAAPLALLWLQRMAQDAGGPAPRPAALVSMRESTARFEEEDNQTIEQPPVRTSYRGTQS